MSLAAYVATCFALAGLDAIGMRLGHRVGCTFAARAVLASACKGLDAAAESPPTPSSRD